MRNLKTVDLFSLSRILKKMNLKEDIKNLAKDVTGLSEEEKIKAEDEMKISLVMLFAENIGNVEKEVYKLFSDITDKSVKDLQDMNLIDFVNLIKELFEQDGFDDFLKLAVK